MNGIARHTRLLAAVSAVLFLLLKTGCTKDDPIVPLTLLSIEADGVNLMDAGGATVAVTAPISAIFSTNINPSTVTDSTVTMLREYDQTPVPLVLIVSRSTLSIKSVVDLLPGAQYTLTITSGLKSTHDLAFPSFIVTFKTTGTFVAPGLKAYWSFENSATDVIGTFDPNPSLDVVDITYVPGRNTNAGKAASFNGTTSIIQIPSGATLLSPEFTMSFWMLLNSDQHVTTEGKKKSSYVVGLGNSHGLGFAVDSTYQSVTWFQSYLEADKETKTMNEFKFLANGVLDGEDIEEANVVNEGFGQAGLEQRLNNVWAHVVMTFKDTVNIRSLYLNGSLVFQQNLPLLNDSDADSLQSLATVVGLTFIADTAIPATYNDKLAFGFWQNLEATYGEASDVYSNPDAFHFQGLLDDVRIFTRALTTQEVELMYNDEKP